MISVNLSQSLSPTGWTTVLALLAGAILFHLIPSRSKPMSSLARHASDPTQSTRGIRLLQVNPDKDETDTDIDIIAIHGLDTGSPDTWIWRARSPNEQDVNWLAHPDMLPKEVERARIFYCDWPANMLQKRDSIPTTLEDSAGFFLRLVRNHLATNRRAGRNRPIVFIASCLGGIILIKALDIDDSEPRDADDPASLRGVTRGIVFLATPFRGTAFKDVPVPIFKAWASLQDHTVTALIDYAKEATPNLDGLVDKFVRLQKAKEYHVFTFWEGEKTTLLRKFNMAWMFSNWMLLAWLVVLPSAWLLASFSPWLLVVFFPWLSGFLSYQPKLVRSTEHLPIFLLQDGRCC
jgi:hypothetical protein